MRIEDCVNSFIIRPKVCGLYLREINILGYYSAINVNKIGVILSITINLGLQHRLWTLRESMFAERVV